MCHVPIPCNMKEALKLDEETCSDNWKKATRLEIQQHTDYDTFLDKGLRNQITGFYPKFKNPSGLVLM